MTGKITCPACGSDSFEVQSGPEGEPYYAVVCLDCGEEMVLDDAGREALKRQRGL